MIHDISLEIKEKLPDDFKPTFEEFYNREKKKFAHMEFSTDKSFDLNKKDWKAKIIYVDAKSIVGQIIIPNIDMFTKNEFKEINYNFIYSKTPIGNDSAPQRGRINFYNLLNEKQRMFIEKYLKGKFRVEVFEKVRLYEEKLRRGIK